MSDATNAVRRPQITAKQAFDALEPGDRVLWGDRKQPCTVARVVEPGDRVGQTLAVSVIGPGIEKIKRQKAARDGDEYDPEDYFLEAGDVFADPRVWGRLLGKTFVVIQGPRGGFYAIAKPAKGRRQPALFRAVRSFHSTKLGRPGQGAWNYEQDFQGKITVVATGDAPEELDPVGDLPAYDEIKGNRVVGYDLDDHEHFVVADTLEEAFDIGLGEAHRRAEERYEAEHEDEVDEPDHDIPAPERVEGTPSGVDYATATVTKLVDTSYGKKAVIEAPAPWDMPTNSTPINEVIKSLPWEACHYEFDSDRKAWLVDADELTKVASGLRDAGFVVRAEYDLDAIAA